MTLVHAIWHDAALHLWGECAPKDKDSIAPEAASSTSPPAFDTLLISSPQDLRTLIGDHWDSLLVSEARPATLTLNLPHRAGRPLRSTCPLDQGEIALLPIAVQTLRFAPADAVDLLTSMPTFAAHDVQSTASIRFWSRTAGVVLELLASQRFVPDLHRAGSDRHLAFWRVVVQDQATSGRVGSLIRSMPALCRAVADGGAVVQASDLVENFMWTSVDSLVRRSLEGDELAHALRDRSRTDPSIELQWLSSLVGNDPLLRGDSAECDVAWAKVRTWLSKLQPSDAERTCRTCFRLHEPQAASGSAPQAGERSWRLTYHVQAVHDRNMVLDAARLWNDSAEDPLILQRPFEGARQQLRSDLERAARFVPALLRSVSEEKPTSCTLTVDEAYSFLRDAIAILENEGFTVYLPRWWRMDRPRLGMQLRLRGSSSAASTGQSGLSLETLVDYDWHVALGDEELSPEEITRLADSKTPLVQCRGTWVEVQSSEVKTAMQFLSGQSSGQMTIFEALRRSYFLDDFETGLPVLGLQAEDWMDKLINATHLDKSFHEVDPPKEFHGTLRAYQLKALGWFTFLKEHGLGACLADDMGLGKTIQLIGLWLLEREQADVPGPTLLVVPMSLVGNWQREIEKFAPSLRVLVHHGLERLTGRAFADEVGRFDVVISTYGLVQRDFSLFADIEWHRIALDEAQNIKNPAAKQTTAIRSLRAVHRVALTGTPVENRLSELWSIMEFLNPGYLGTAGDFRRRFAVPIERHQDNDRARRLRHLIQPFMLRRLKTDPEIKVDLPDKLQMRVFCNLTREQAALYESIVGNMLGQIDQAQGIARRGLILATLLRLKQICNHPAQFLGDGSDLPHRSGKCDRITEMLEEVIAEGDCALVFTQFRRMGELLKTLLQESLDREMLLLHGGSSRKERDHMIDRFQDGESDLPVFILSLKAGGFGLNLTAANHVFHFDRWWNPAVEDQATDRAHRIGQTKQVQVHKFVCVGTLEERIDAMLEHKRSLAKNVMGSGEEWVTGLSTQALRELFALSKDAVAEDV